MLRAVGSEEKIKQEQNSLSPLTQLSWMAQSIINKVLQLICCWYSVIYNIAHKISHLLLHKVVCSIRAAYLASLIKNIKYENKEKTFNIVEK